MSRIHIIGPARHEKSHAMKNKYDQVVQVKITYKIKKKSLFNP